MPKQSGVTLDSLAGQMEKLTTQVGELAEQNAYVIKYLTGGGLIQDMKQHFPTKEEFAVLKTDVRGLKTDVGGLKQMFAAHEKKEDERYNRIMKVLDAHTKLLLKLDQERLFQIQRIDRLEKELKEIKVHLGLA